MVDYKQVPASSVPPGKDPDVATYQDVRDIISKYMSEVNMDMLDQYYYNNGKAKEPPTKLSVTQLIQSINMLMYDYIKTNNNNQTTDSSNIVSGYFDGVNKLTKILDNTKIDVAETKMLCYIIGYLIKLLNNFNDTSEQKN